MMKLFFRSCEINTLPSEALNLKFHVERR